MLINVSPYAILDISVLENDKLSFPFQVLDDANNPVNFSGYTSAKMTIRSNELSSEVLSFTSTGATYQIDISSLSTGQFTLFCNSLVISSGGYQYDFEVRNSTQKQTVMGGKFIVKSNITV